MIAEKTGSGVSVRALTEGALMAAMAAVLGIIGIYIPVLAFVTGLFWSIPIILLVMRHSIKVGLMGLVVAGTLISFVAGPVQALLLVVNLGGMAIAYGCCFKKKQPPIKTLLIGTVIAALSTAATVILSSFVANLPITHMISQFKGVVDEAFDMYRQMGVLDKILPEGMTPDQYKEQIYKMIETLLPGAFVAGSMGAALINYLIARKILKRLKYRIPEMPPFSNWHFPWYIVWGVIAALGLLLLGKYLQNQIMVLAGQNILYIYYPLLLISGLSVAVYYWKAYQPSGALKILIIFGVIMFINVVFFMILVVGLFDPLFDYRRFARGNKDTA